MAAAFRDVEAATLALDGSPRLPEPPFRRAVPTTPADERVRVSMLRMRLAGGSASALTFEACSASLTLRPPDRSTAKAALSRGSSPAGYPAEPLVSYQINRQLSGWNPPPLVIRAFGAHGQTRTSSLGAVRPLPPRADIGPGGQSVGQAAQFCIGVPVRRYAEGAY